MLLSSFRECLRRLTVEISERRRWRNAGEMRSGIRVFYGYDKLGGEHEFVGGGIVKTQDIQKLYANSPEKPTLLYLVSSALPPYAVRMANLARTNGAKVVLNQNGVAYPAWNGGAWKNTNRIMRGVLEAADYVFYQSRFCKMGAERYLGHPRCRFEILYNPVDTDYFVPLAKDSDDGRSTLLLAGSHCHFYRVKCAIETVAALHSMGYKTRLVIAGRNCWSSDERKASQDAFDLARRLGVGSAVDFVGPYTQKEAVGLFHRAGMLLHTKYNDPCPRLVVEAMACGLPVVYSASGGVPELVGEEAGIGIPAPLDWAEDHPPDPRALADAVVGVLERYEYYAGNARNRAVQHFDVRPWLERHREVFEKLTA